MKKTAKAPANIAFIKYWGRKDEDLRLPLNSSISLNLSNAYTITTVEFSPKYKEDSVFFLEEDRHSLLPFEGGRRIENEEKERIIQHLERLRKIAKVKAKAKVVTQNNFPQKAGIASSASGFAALTMAAAASLGLNLSEKKLSILARLASGSACRSIPDGFVEWRKGDSSEESFAYSLYKENYWNLRDIILIVEEKEKEVSSSSGQKQVFTSPFLKVRLKNLPKKIAFFKKALKEKDFASFGKILEEEAIEMHTIMMTQNPPLFYLSGQTLELIKKIRNLRKDGLELYFTLDAGPNVHLFCKGKNEKKVLRKLKELKEVKKIIVNKPAKGARLIEKHLF